MGAVIGIVEAVRNIRGEMGVHPSTTAPLYLSFADSDLAAAVMENSSYIEKLAKTGLIREGRPPEAERPVASAVVTGIEIAVPLGEVIDIEVEKGRLTKEVERVRGLIRKTRAKLEDREFVSKAPSHVVDKEKEKLEQLEQNAAKLKANLEMLLG
jgi:valyl-tRNA synthetase